MSQTISNPNNINNDRRFDGATRCSKMLTVTTLSLLSLTLTITITGMLMQPTLIETGSKPTGVLLAVISAVLYS